MDYSRWSQGGGKVLSNILAYIILVTLDINLSNFTQNFLRIAFDPYTSLFGNMTWGIIFGFIGAGIFVGSKSIVATFTYLVIVGLVFAAILPSAIIGIFGLILAFIAGTAFYVILIEK